MLIRMHSKKMCACIKYTLHNLYLILLPRPSIGQYDQRPSPVLHVVQEIRLAGLNQERL